ncbi:SDR family oxidoreductase [Neisseria sp. Ec49-e6-T10]|uniref:SDR family oxidoreductase n=1 Tax=Neisseria sp. Ec49-e6-T10 TaxID=3140744 RepID=UPI003EBC84FB
MDLFIKDKVYIITGGGSGIGGGISVALAREGAIPVIFGRSDLTEEVASVIYDLQPKTLFIKLDLANNDSGIENAIKEVVHKLGRIDGLVNCAGANDGIALEDEPNAFRKSLENNLIHYFTMAHFCIDELKKTKGTILNVSSKTALTGQGNTSAYTAAKGAQLSLTREWAASYLKDGIRVNCLIPAEVWTPLYEKWINTFDDPQAKLETITRNIPLEKRMTTVEEMADTAVFILSPRSSHTTGQWIIPDGGYTHLDRALTA